MTEADIILKALESAFKSIDFNKASKDAEAKSEAQSEPHTELQAEEIRASDTTVKYSQEFYEKAAQEYIDFTYNNPTIFHVAKFFEDKLDKAGFTYVSEKDSWKNLKAGKYYTVRNGSSLVAFIVGKDWTPERGAGIIGSHIDALTTVVKAASVKDKVDGYELLGVAPYAGALSDVWWDRDLGIGGRLIVKQDSGKKVVQKLVDSTPHPIARIPTLAPHFGTPSRGPFNKETQAVPVVGYSSGEDEEPTEEEKSAPLYGKHSLKLLRYISKLAQVKVSDILEWDLQLFDVQKGNRGGLNHEFIFSPRIDDRICSFTALYSIIDADVDSLVKLDSLSIVHLVDNEEIGSGTRQGIKGGLLELVISRILSSSNFKPASGDVYEHLQVVFANSIILSADVNHLFNPNFSSVYLEHNKPVPNEGLALAIDTNGSFATDSVGLALVKEIARLNNDKLQYIQGRNDIRNGSSIGPLVSTQTGARTIDIGIAQLSMHSIRAAVGYKDVGLGIKYFNGFFEYWRQVYDTFTDI